MRSKELEFLRKKAWQSSQKELVIEIDRVSQGRPPWWVYDAPLTSFQESFAYITPGEDLKKYVLDLKKKKEILESSDQVDFQAAEIMGPGSELFSDFPLGTFTCTVGITLFDHRVATQVLTDTQRNHTVIPCDVNDSQFSDILSNAHEGRGFDVIIFRPIAGLNSLPRDVLLQFEYMSILYNNLHKSGVFIGQIPKELQSFASEWYDSLQKKGTHIEADFGTHNNVVRIVRSEASPDVLPGLSVRRMLRDPDYRCEREKRKVFIK